MSIILDPILKEIDIDKDALSIINTQAFQRLGRIKQTGYSDYVFPGLTQTRLAHSLGIYGICQYLIKNNSDIQDNLSKYEQLILKYSALLHDIGHGPNSHFFERLTKRSHEKMTIMLIKRNVELNKALRKIHRSLPNDICRVIKKTYRNPIMAQIISSHVDIDRMDYLMRDSYYSGLNHGLIDFRYILRNICIVDKKICFKEIAINSIENFLIARYHMYRTIYYNTKSDCFEWLIVKIVHRILSLYKNSQLTNISLITKLYLKLLTTKKIDEECSPEEYCLADDYTFYSFIISFKDSKDLILKLLISDWQQHRRFKYILIVNKKTVKEAKRLKKALISKYGGEQSKFLYEHCRLNARYTCAEFFKTKNITKPPILILRDGYSKTPVTITTFSKIIRALNTEFTGGDRYIDILYYRELSDDGK